MKAKTITAKSSKNSCRAVDLRPGTFVATDDGRELKVLHVSGDETETYIIFCYDAGRISLSGKTRIALSH